MKTKLLILLMGTHLLCFGQTINAPTIPAAGVEFTVKNMSTAVSNVPVNGVWDFSNEVTTDGQNFKLLSISSSSQASTFPLATHVRLSGTSEEAYVAYNGNQYKFCGSMFMPYLTPLLMHSFPLSNGYNHVDSAYVTFPGPGTDITRKDKIQVNALSLGTLKMPDGTVYNNALLVKNYRTFGDVPASQPGSTYTTVLDMYHWWVDGFPVPIVETRLQTNPNNPTIFASSTFRKPLVSTGIQVSQTMKISIYPNPTNNIINIEGLNKNENNTIQIFDVQGKLVSTKIVNERGTIDLSELNKGVYVIKIGEYAKRVVKI